MRHTILPFTCLFEGGAAGSGAGAAAGAAEGAAPASAQENKGVAEKPVLYGKQPEAQAEPAASPPEAHAEEKPKAETPEERKARYKAAVSGEFKAEFDADMQRAVRSRLKDASAREAAVKPIVDLLAQRYGIADGDVSKIAEALGKDNDIWQRQADDAGMDVNQFREYKRMERESAMFRQMQQTEQERERTQQQTAAWVEEANAMRGTPEAPGPYPDFDLGAEVNGDPKFLRLLQVGIPVQEAYEVVHRQELMQRAAASAAQEAEKKVVDNIRARGTRPTEGGAAAQTGAIVKDDVSNLNAKDRREIAMRARRGEKIIY